MVAITNRSSDEIILTIAREWADQFADEQIVICRKWRGNVVDIIFVGRLFAFTRSFARSEEE